MTTDLPPAEQHAIDKGLPIVPVLLHDLMSAMTGNPIIVRLLDGQEALLRLATAEEAYRFHVEAVGSLDERARPSRLATPAEMARLVEPVSIPGW